MKPLNYEAYFNLYNRDADKMRDAGYTSKEIVPLNRIDCALELLRAGQEQKQAMMTIKNGLNNGLISDKNVDCFLTSGSIALLVDF